MIKNLILDYNGVISNDFELVYKTSMRLFEKYGLDQIDFVKFKEKFKIPVTEFWKEVLPNVNFDELNANYFEIYKTFGIPKPYFKAKEILEQLHNKGVTLVILSSHKKENIFSELKAFGIDPNIFDSINSDVKNKLEVIDEIIKNNELISRETAYIGDTEHDIETAKKAKVFSMASTYGYRTKKQLQNAQPDLFVDSISELTKAFDPNMAL